MSSFSNSDEEQVLEFVNYDSKHLFWPSYPKLSTNIYFSVCFLVYAETKGQTPLACVFFLKHSKNTYFPPLQTARPVSDTTT